MKELEQEAEKYAMDNYTKTAFKAGATSDYVSNEIVKAKIASIDKYILDERYCHGIEFLTAHRTAMIDEITELKTQLK